MPLNQKSSSKGDMSNVQNRYGLEAFIIEYYFDMTAFQQMLEDLTF